MENITFVNSFALDHVSGIINLASDDIRIALVDNTSNINVTLSKLSEVTGELITAGGYVQNGEVLTNSVLAQYDSAVTFDSDPVSWNATGAGFTCRRYVMFTGDALIGFGLVADSDIDVVVPATIVLQLGPLPDLGWFTEQPERPGPIQTITIPGLEFTEGDPIAPTDMTIYFNGEGVIYEWLNAIPDGLELSGKGLLTGTPTTQGIDAVNVIQVSNSGGVLSSNNFEVDVTGEFSINDQPFLYGLNTPDTKGYVTVKPVSGVVSSIIIDGATLGSAADFETVGDTIRTVAGSSFSSDTVLNCTAIFVGGATDTFDAPLTAESNSISISDDAEWDAWLATGTTYGINPRLREFVFNDVEGDKRIKFSGTPPAGDPNDLITVKTDPGADVRFRRLMIDNGGGGGADGFRFEDIFWEKKTNTGIIFAQQFGVDGLTFARCKWAVEDGTTGDATTGVQLGYNGQNIIDVHFDECEMDNLNNGIIGAGEGFQMTNFTGTNIYNDGLIHSPDATFPTPNDCVFRNVLMHDKLYGGIGSHGDNEQLNWAVNGVGPVTGLVIDNVKMFRGTGTPGEEDGQGFFAPGLLSGKIVAPIITNNFYHATFGNGLMLRDTEDAQFIGNTVIFDLTNEAGVPTSAAAIMNTGNGLNSIIKDNIFNTWDDTGSVSTDDDNNLIVAANQSAYDAAFKAPKSGSALTPGNLYDSYDNLVGSIADLAVPKMGAFPYSTLPGKGNNGISAHPRLETPTGLVFSDVADADASTLFTTATVPLTNINVFGALVEVSAGEYRIRNAADDTTIQDWQATPGIIQDGERLQLRNTSSPTNGVTIDTVVTVGTVVDTWSITTVVASYIPNYYATSGSFGDNILTTDPLGANTKEAFFSGWLDIAAAGTHYLMSSSGLQILKVGTNITITCKNAGGTTIYDRSYTVANAPIPFFHLAISIKLDEPGHDYVLVDGVSVGGSASVFTDDIINHAATPVVLWARSTSFDRMISDKFGDWIIHNISQPINTAPGLAKLRTLAGEPVDLGADGSGAIAVGSPRIAITQVAAVDVLPVTSPGVDGTNNWNQSTDTAPPTLPVQTARATLGEYFITDFV